jgi:flagellar biosynthetic protein FliQ
MDPSSLLELAREAIFVLLKTSAPVLLAALFVGLIVSLFQALTQIQETTLSFVPKIMAVFGALLVFSPYMIDQLKTFTEHISNMISNIP